MKLLKLTIILLILGAIAIPWLRNRPAETFKGYEEVVAKRTATSQTFQVDDNTFVTRIYALPEEKSFGLIPSALADTIYAVAGDGFVRKDDNTNWTTTRSAASGVTADSTGTTNSVSTSVSIISGEYTITRAFLPFNTAVIPANALVTAASLNIYVTAVFDGDNDGNDFINVINTSQAAETTLATSDYSKITLNSPSVGSTAKDLTSDFTTSAYNTFTLNATGISWVEREGQTSTCSTNKGVTCLGLREGHDINNDAPSGLGSNQIQFSTSETSGTSQDPYLEVTYTIPTTGTILQGNAVLMGNMQI